MLMLIWNNIARRRSQSVLTVTITLLTVLVFVMVLGVFQTVNQGLALSRERLGADAVLVPKYSSVEADDLLFTAIPSNIYMPVEVVEQAKELEGAEAMTAQFYCQTLALGCCEPGEEVRIIGYDSSTDFILKPYLDEASQSSINQEQLIVGSNFEDQELVGSNYMILGRVFKVVSMLQPTGTGMDSTIFMDWRTAQDLCLENEVLRENWTKKDPHDCISVIMIKFADILTRMPIKDMRMDHIHSLLHTGWLKGKFANNNEKGRYALDFAKIMHGFGRTDLAYKLTVQAKKLLTGKAKAGAADAAEYYKKILFYSHKFTL